jgi:triphosphatase
LLLRREWEDPIASKRPVIDAPKTGKRLPGSVREQDLRRVFTTSVTRTVIEIEPYPSTRIEAAIDEGEIRTADGSGVEPISEIELELKSGDPAALFDVALRLLEAAPVRIETRSKAERGYQLLGAAGLPQAVHAEPVEAALERIGRRCLAHLRRNELATLAGEPEGVHQMRVAVRRLRSALSALKPMLPAKHHRWASKELKWLADALGPARNWDVFVANLLRPVADTFRARQDLECLFAAAERCRREASENAKQAIFSQRYTESMLRLSRWFAARGRSPQARERYLPSIPSDTRHGPSRRQGICILHDTVVMIATLVMIAGIKARGGEADAYCD